MNLNKKSNLFRGEYLYARRSFADRLHERTVDDFRWEIARRFWQTDVAGNVLGLICERIHIFKKLKINEYKFRSKSYQPTNLSVSRKLAKKFKRQTTPP